MEIRVASIDHHTAMRQRLHVTFTRSPTCRSVGAFERLGDLLPAMSRCAPEVVIVGELARDESMVEAVRRIAETAPGAKVIVYTSASDELSVLGALRAGAGGYVLRSSTPRQLVASIEEASRGEVPLSGEVARHLVDSLRRPAPPPARPPEPGRPRLSRRETEVYDLLVGGLRYRDIAERLFISIETVRSHVRRIYRKLGVASRAELTARLVS